MAGENRLKLIQQADKLFKQGRIEAALKEYKKILDLKPDDLEIRKIIGDVELKLNNIGEAVHQFEWIADYYLKEGFYPKATAMYKRITRVDPQNESVSYKLADLYSKQGLLIEAKQIYLELVEEYKRKSNNKKALGIYKKILELDRGNTKMHLLLAENYLRENMTEEAVSEYIAAADLLMKKKEIKQAEEILQESLKKTKDIRLTEKLIHCFLQLGEEDQAIQYLTSIGEEIYKHQTLLKMLGELYLKKNLIERAERIYLKLIEYDSSQTEMIMNLGKVYLQKDDFDKAYQLFLPVVDQFINSQKFDEATAMLRFIITSNNTYLPALLKLASIFKMTHKVSSLIAIYESLLPIYEKKEMKEELQEVLKELITISDSPFNYQEQLEKLTSEKKDESEDSHEKSFINFHLTNINNAIRENDFKKANDILLTTKSAFPRNIEIRTKLFDLYQLTGNIEALMNEGVELLQIYKDDRMDAEYNSLYEKLSRFRPNDERLLFLSGNEKTNIEIDFDHKELIEQMSELHYSAMDEKEEPEEEVFLLEGEDSLAFKQIQTEKEYTKGLSSHLVELDFYISEGYFDNAEKIIDRLKSDYPESSEVIARLERLKKIQEERGERKPKERSVQEEVFISPSVSDESDILQKLEDSKFDIDVFTLKADENSHPLLDERPIEAEEKEIEKIPEEEIVKEPMEELTGRSEKYSEKMESSPHEADIIDEIQFEIEMDRPEPQIFTPEKIKEERHVSPSPALTKSKADTGISSEMLSFDNILNIDEASIPIMESPFKDIDELAFESEEELLKENGIFIEEEDYFETERLVPQELEALKFWAKELEKQRTSTMEKNMMEIFKEFKKGVDEKIGHEDVDTRYNLGIAYKEMGLLEEAIHEFLISAKSSNKFFDSAGMLGICFREKGMIDESINWFENALKTPERHVDEIRAIKFELFLSVKQKEDYSYASKLAAEIIKEDPDYRNIKQLYFEIKDK